MASSSSSSSSYRRSTSPVHDNVHNRSMQNRPASRDENLPLSHYQFQPQQPQHPLPSFSSTTHFLTFDADSATAGDNEEYYGDDNAVADATPSTIPRACSSSVNDSYRAPASTFKFNLVNPPSLMGPQGGGATSTDSSVVDLHQQQQQAGGAKESVTVTVRFRPLSLREIQRGDEVAWYADGDNGVRSEYNPNTAYAFDKVFGPATVTKAVYDVAGRHVVRGVMEGINGTVFAYGVTSSGKTHTMHGDLKSPGIIPLAVKDVFNIIQETPDREYLLRVSYLEIYNEVINDLLDPAGQNLRIREDSQGTYVEAIKEEVVLSPAHALSLIAAGEEHRHVGSNNFNLISSRSHTIFTLTIESSSRTSDQYDDDEITLSQLNLIDLAGSESSKTETTGLRRKEGSYINKSLLTLGTVIGKLSEGKASHVPFRDSKLTRLLQSSLSGHGRVSLICTLTPASSSIEETHNTLKFAHRAKRVALHAAPNRIIDDKSLIKKYQKEIMILRHELEQLKSGMPERMFPIGATSEDMLTLRQQLEAGQVKLQSRLEEEEHAKAALLGRIQRLTKLILVSTKTTTGSPITEQVPRMRRRHSFGEEELRSYGARRPKFASDFSDDSSLPGHMSEQSLDGKVDVSSVDEIYKLEKKVRRRSMLGWLKLRKNKNGLEADASLNAPPASVSSSVVQLDSMEEPRAGPLSIFSGNVDEVTRVVAETFREVTQAGELFSSTPRGRRRPPPGGETMADQMELLREQVKMLAGDVALCTSSLKRMSEQALHGSPNDLHMQAQMEKTKVEIEEKKRQIWVLEQRIIETGQAALAKASPLEMSETISNLMAHLNEKEFELEIKSADNRILQEQLHSKAYEIKNLQETIKTLQEYQMQLEESVKQKKSRPQSIVKRSTSLNIHQFHKQAGGADADGSDTESYSSKGSSRNVNAESNFQSQILMQAAQLENLRQERVYLEEENGGLHLQCEKLAEEASYAKELASAAAVELKNLAEEVTKLALENSKLVDELHKSQEAHSVLSLKFTNLLSMSGVLRNASCNDDHGINGHADVVHDDIDSWNLDPDDMRRELHARKEREAYLEAVLDEREQAETELRKKLEESKQREAGLENDLAGMWVLVAKLKKEKKTSGDPIGLSCELSENVSMVPTQENDRLEETVVDMQKTHEGQHVLEELQDSLNEEKLKNGELRMLVSQMKSEDLEGLEFSMLEELQSLHVEALTKLFQAKARSQEKVGKDREHERSSSIDQQDDERNSHVCKICFESPTAAVLLPCRHFCLCKPCAVACTECPLCRRGIADRIITFTS